MKLRLRWVVFSAAIAVTACGKSGDPAAGSGSGSGSASSAGGDEDEAARAAVAAAVAAADAGEAAPDAGEPDAAEAAKPTFADPASEAAFADLQSALEQLQERGDQHARYFDDCRGVWLAVEESPLVKEKDPAVVKLVDDVAAFCLRDLALKSAGNRMDVIDTMEDALEKKVTKFSQDGWDRVCGEPLEMIKKAEKRYADDDRFKGLSAPIAKRCGKRPK